MNCRSNPNSKEFDLVWASCARRAVPGNAGRARNAFSLHVCGAFTQMRPTQHGQGERVCVCLITLRPRAALPLLGAAS